MSEGYIRLFFGVALIVLILWFIKIKMASLDYITNQYNRDPKYKIEIFQRHIRKYVSIGLAVVCGLLIFGFGFVPKLIGLFYWLDFSFPDLKNGYDAAAILLFTVVKAILLVVTTILFLLIGSLGGLLAFGGTFLFLVFGSLIQVPFIFNLIMTGVYVSPDWIDIEYAWVPIALGIVSFTLSDIADITILVLDKMSAKIG